MISNDVSIIIPTKTVDALTERCLKHCRNLYPSIEIFVFADELGGEQDDENLHFFSTGPITIAKKRNLGAEKSERKYLAFIDSDAFPHEGWLENAILAFENKEVGAVGGPNLPPPEETFQEKLSGLALNSLFVAGPAYWEKSGEHPRNVFKLSSCNMLVRRKDYIEVGGMNEELRTGEDLDLALRIRRAGLKLLFSPDVKVYHRNRSFKGFFWQRFVCGASTWEVLKATRSSGFLYLTAPFLFLSFLALFPIFFWQTAARPLFLSLLALYTIILIFESWRLGHGLKQKTALLGYLVIGNLTPGLGSWLTLLYPKWNPYSVYNNNE